MGIKIKSVISFVKNIEKNTEIIIITKASFLSFLNPKTKFSEICWKNPLSFKPVVIIMSEVKITIVVQSTNSGYFLILQGNKKDNKINVKMEPKRK